MLRRWTLLALVALCIAVGALPASAQTDFDQVEITTVPVADGVWMLVGAGGNIGVSAGADGIVLIDDQFAPLTEKIRAAVAKIQVGPVRFVLNTHWHFDHTGGNESLGKAGVLIVAHDNVRQRMEVGQLIDALKIDVPASPKEALPVVTFNDTVTFHLNGDEVHAFHVPPAHTDGDSVVHFKKAHAIHMGDVFFNGGYPFIDLSSGGSVDGVIGAADRVLALADDETKIIPGHGPLADAAALRSYRDMLRTVRDRVAALIEEGKSLDEVKSAKPSAEYDEAWGSGFINAEQFLTSVYESLSAQRGR